MKPSQQPTRFARACRRLRPLLLGIQLFILATISVCLLYSFNVFVVGTHCHMPPWYGTLFIVSGVLVPVSLVFSILDAIIVGKTGKRRGPLNYLGICNMLLACTPICSILIGQFLLALFCYG